MVRRARTKAVAKRPDDGAPARIISAAEKLFASRGYDGTSTKDICDLAGVNIAAIHYHFGSKDQLFRHIIETFGGERLEAVERILKGPETYDELRLRLEMFLTESLDVCVNQPNLCRIVQVEIELLHSRSEDVFRSTFIKLSETLARFLAQAKKRGLVSKPTDPKIAAQFFFNQLRQATRADAVNQKYFNYSIRDEKYRKVWIEQTVAIFLNGVASS
jgi:AcrR family transcriptional regulator